MGLVFTKHFFFSSFFFCRRAKEVWPNLQGSNPEQVRPDVISGTYCKCVKCLTQSLFQCLKLYPLYFRGCTDIVCCILFIIAILGYFAVGILGKETALQSGLHIKNTHPWKYRKPLCNLWTSMFVFPAWSQGDPRKVIYPTDSRGQFCGQAGTPLEWVAFQN